MVSFVTYEHGALSNISLHQYPALGSQFSGCRGAYTQEKLIYNYNPTNIVKMEIQMSGTVGAQLRSASKKLGFKEQELVRRAVLVYLDSLEKQRSLKQEMEDWDSLSDEALIEFERSL